MGKQTAKKGSAGKQPKPVGVQIQVVFEPKVEGPHQLLADSAYQIHPG